MSPASRVARLPRSTEALVLPRAAHSQAAINPGNSGGPVFNMSGQVVGMASCSRDAHATGYIVPLPVIHTFLKNARIAADRCDATHTRRMSPALPLASLMDRV